MMIPEFWVNVISSLFCSALYDLLKGAIKMDIQYKLGTLIVMIGTGLVAGKSSR